MLAAVLAAAGSAGALPVQTVALSDQVAPGSDGARFQSFQPPVLNAHGETAFGAVLTSASGNQGIWHSDAGGALTKIVREGDATSDAQTIVGVRPFPMLNDGSQVAFASGRSPAGEAGFWVVEPGAEPVLFASENAPAAGLPANARIDDFENFDPRFSNAGVPVFEATTDGTSTAVPASRAVFGPGSGERSSAVARLGDAVGPGTIQSFRTRSHYVDDAGRVLLGARLDVGGPETPLALVVTDPGGALEARAVEGGAAPGLAGAVFEAQSREAFGSYRLNDAGQVAVGASVRLDGGFDGGIWVLEPGGGGALLVRNGDAVSGAPGLRIMLAQGASISFNDVAQVSVLGNVEGPGGLIESAVLGPDGGGGLALLARRGDAAEGLPDGASYETFRSPTLNARGETAFLAFLDGILRDPEDPFSGDGNAIYFADAFGDLRLAVGTGSAIEVAPGDVRTVTAVNFWEGAFAARGQSSFNDSGQLAFRAEFRDGSQGIFVATVPEPSTALLLAGGLVALAFAGRRPAA